MPHLSVKCSPAFSEAIDWYAKRLGVRRSSAIRHALETQISKAGLPKTLAEKLEKAKGVGHA